MTDPKTERDEARGDATIARLIRERNPTPDHDKARRDAQHWAADNGLILVGNLARCYFDKCAEVERLRGVLECVDVALTRGDDDICNVCGHDDNKHCSACTARMHLRIALTPAVEDSE